jgi:hypothetical protein
MQIREARAEEEAAALLVFSSSASIKLQERSTSPARGGYTTTNAATSRPGPTAATLSADDMTTRILLPRTVLVTSTAESYAMLLPSISLLPTLYFVFFASCGPLVMEQSIFSCTAAAAGATHAEEARPAAEAAAACV